MNYDIAHSIRPIPFQRIASIGRHVLHLLFSILPNSKWAISFRIYQFELPWLDFIWFGLIFRKGELIFGELTVVSWYSAVAFDFIDNLSDFYWYRNKKPEPYELFGLVSHIKPYTYSQSQCWEGACFSPWHSSCRTDYDIYKHTFTGAMYILYWLLFPYAIVNVFFSYHCFFPLLLLLILLLLLWPKHFTLSYISSYQYLRFPHNSFNRKEL